MKRTLCFAAVMALSFSEAALSQTTLERGDSNAGITGRTTQTSPARNASQSNQATRPSQVSPVRPLSQEDRQRQEAASERRRQSAASGDPDVLLDIPNLSVEEITLEVDNLRARVSLDARLANLLQLTAGADAAIDKVKLTIKGVRAEVLLKVHLDNVAAIIDRTLTTIDRNPQILERLLESVDSTVGTVGGVANTALQPGGVVGQTVGTVGQTLNNVTQPNGLLGQTVNSLGQTVQRTVDQTGNLVERTVDRSGTLINQRTIGSVLDSAASGLSVVGETTNQSGQTVRRLRDAQGGTIEVTLDDAGNIVNSRVLSGATGGRRR